MNITAARRVLLAAAALAVLAVLVMPGRPAQAVTVAHRTAWSRVLTWCHRHGCRQVPAAIRADLGIGRLPARIHYGDTTVIWVRERGGRVRIFTS